VTEQAGRSLQVYLDNVLVGTTPWTGDVPTGKHMVALRSNALGASEVAAMIAEGATSTLQLTAVPLERDTVTPPAVPPARRLWSVGAEGGPVFVPSLGGVVSECAGVGCTRSGAGGWQVLGRAGHELAKAWAMSFEAGYLEVGQDVTARVTQAIPKGLAAIQGHADDSLAMRGAILGAALSVRPELPADPLVRLRLGSFLGTMTDTRTSFTSQDGDWQLGPTTMHRFAAYAYASLTAELGFRPLPRWRVGIGFDVTAMAAVLKPAWDPSLEFRSPDGVTHFEDEDIAGKWIFLLTPMATLGYDL
jgi:hypothetical protein